MAGTTANRKWPLGRDVSRSARDWRGLCLGAGLWVSPGLWASGCVLPIAPEFEAEKNEQPVLVNANPAPGSNVSGDIKPVFSVEIRDPNATDTLFARWLIDYPPYNQEIHRLASNTRHRQDVELENRVILGFQPDCTAHNISPSLTRHRLMLVVSDRDFLVDADRADKTRLDLTPSDAYSVRSYWTFDMECNPR